MVSKFHDGLSQDLLLMLNNGNDHDVIIQVGENHIKEFRAHSNILKACSPYFNNTFSTRLITIIKFNTPKINPNVFEMTLKYVEFIIFFLKKIFFLYN